MLDYWRDCNHRFYLSYDNGYLLRTEDEKHITYLVKEDIENLIKSLQEIANG